MKETVSRLLLRPCAYRIMNVPAVRFAEMGNVYDRRVMRIRIVFRPRVRAVSKGLA